MDPEIMQLLMECRQILAEMKVSTQRLAEKYQEYKQSETQMEESEEDLLSESSIAAQEKKMEVSIEDESQSEMKVTTQALQEKFHESKKSETKNESITKNETKNFIPKPLILPQISTTSPARPDIFISDNIIINGAELTQPNCYISDQAILSPTSNFSFSLSSFTSDLPPFSLPQFHFCSQSYPFAELQPFSYGAQIPTLLFNNPLNITSSTYDDGIFTLSLSSFECPSLTQSNSSYIEASAALTAKGYSLMTVALDLQLSQFEDDERVLTVFATVDSAMGGKSCNNSEWRLIWEKGKNAYHVFTKMTQRDLQNVSSLILLRDSEVNSLVLFSVAFSFPSNNVNSTSCFGDGLASYLFIENTTQSLNSPGLVSKNGKLITMLIDYKNEPKLMKICINYSNTTHGNPVLEVEIDFAEYLKEFMFVELLSFSVACILFHLFERFSFHTIGFLPTLSSPRLDLRNEDLFTVLIDFKRFAGVVSILAILESVRKVSEDQNKGLLTTDLLEGNRKHMGMEDMLKLSDTFKGVQPRPDVVNIEEAKSSLRETGGLNFEEAGALFGKYEYQKGKIEAAVRIFEESDGNLVFAEMLQRILLEHLKLGVAYTYSSSYWSEYSSPSFTTSKDHYIWDDWPGVSIVGGFDLTAAFPAFCYAEFASRCPSAGSAYYYSYACVGEGVAWLVGRSLMLEYTIGGFAIACGISPNLVLLLGSSDRMPTFLNRQYIPALDIVDEPCAAIFIVKVTGLLCLGIKESAFAQAVVTSGNVCAMPFVLVIAGGYLGFKTGWASYDVPKGYFSFGINGVFVGSVTVFFFYIGLDVARAAGEVKNPKRDLPLGIAFSLLICCALYMLVSVVVVGLIPYYELDPDTPISFAFSTQGMQWAAYIILIGASTALCSSLLGSFLPSSLQVSTCVASLVYSGILEDVDGENSEKHVGISKAAILTLIHYGNLSAGHPLILKQSVECTNLHDEKRRKIADWTIMLTCIGAFLVVVTASCVGLPSTPRFTLCAVGVALLISTLIVLSCINQYEARYSQGHTGGFICPLIPLLPIASIIINTYLLVNLGVAT